MTPHDFEVKTEPESQRARLHRLAAKRWIQRQIEDQPHGTLWGGPYPCPWLILVHIDCCAGAVGTRRVTVFDKKVGPTSHSSRHSAAEASEMVMAWLGARAKRRAPSELDEAALSWPDITTTRGWQR